MKKFADFLVDRRYLMLAVILILTIVCGVFALKVPVNKDNTKYLADGSNMKQGLSIMESAFPEEDEKASIRVMFDGISAGETADIKARLLAIPNVSSVDYEADSEDYNRDGKTLFVVNSKFDYDSDEEKAIEAAIGRDFSEAVYRNNDIQETKVPLWLLGTAIVLAVIVLLIMCNSWLEPVLILISIGVAVVLNMGTNIVLPYTAELTASIGPVIQMVLSMDYSIILMNRYRQEKGRHENRIDAMKTALATSISSIASSSLTTAVGLLALLFLSFKLGPELGIVLAKGVFISMVSVFMLLPVMVLAFDKQIEKTEKKAPHIPMGLISKFSFKARYAMPVVFVILLVGSFFMQKSTVITFMEKSEDPLINVFPKDNTAVIIYNTKDEAKTVRIIDELEKDEHVKEVLGYANTLGKEMNAADMYDALEELSDDTRIDEDVIRMLYFVDAQGELPKLTAAEFMHFITDTVMPNDTLNGYLDDNIRDNIKYFDKFSDKAALTKKMNSDEIAEFFDIDGESVRQLFMYYTIQNGVKDSGTMTLPGFTDYVLNTVAKDETYGKMFDAATLASLEQMKTFTDKNTVLAQRTVPELSAMLGINENIVKTVFVFENAGDVSGRTMTLVDFTSFMCDHIMTDPMFASRFDSATKAQLKQMNSLVQVAASGRELPASVMASTLGMDTETVAGLYYLYFSADPEFQEEVANMKMPLEDFIMLLMAGASEEEGQQLLSLRDMARMPGYDGPLDADTLALIMGMDVSQVYQLFGTVLASGRSIKLAAFTDFLVNSVMTNKAYSASFAPEQAAQLQQMNGIIQTAALGAPLDIKTLSQMFGMDANMITTVFRLYFGANIVGRTMSLKAFDDFILADPMMSGMMDAASLGQLRYMQSIIGASVNEAAFTSKELAGFLDMDETQAEQLYILKLSESGEQYMLSPQEFVAFAEADVLNNEEFAGEFDEQSADDLKLGHTLIEAVVSEKAYNADEMFDLLKKLTDDVTRNEIEVMYLYYGGVNDTDTSRTMTIKGLFDFLCDEMMVDERFAEYFDDKSKADILSNKADLEDALEQMKGETYSRLVITADLPDESPETQAYIDRLTKLCESDLSEYYLVGNSAMVSEMGESFANEYLMITLITAIAVFLVVLVAFRNPTLPLILTLIVQCGVFFTVTVIGAYSGSIYYLALLIVQSILMGATIDYGIVFCNFYKESRASMDVAEALRAAYEGSIHTIMTSGSILVLVLAILGLFVSSAMISEVSTTLSIGVFIAIMLILFVLPGLVACCDKLFSGESRGRIS